MPFQTSNNLLGTLPSAKLSRFGVEAFTALEKEKAEALSQPGFSYAKVLTGLLNEGQRLIQDCPDEAHIDKATKVFKAVGFHAYSGHPDFDRLVMESAKGLINCAKEYAQPSNPDVQPNRALAQDALLHAANTITNPEYCYSAESSKKRPIYVAHGIAVRDEITEQLLALAKRIKEKDPKESFSDKGSLTLSCITWAYNLARRKSGLREQAAYLYAEFTKDTKNPHGANIESLYDQSIAPTLLSPAIMPAPALVGADAPEVVRAGQHHHRTDHGTSHPHPATVHAGAER